MLTDIYPHMYTSYIELIIAYSWTICRGYVSAFGQANINAPTHTHTYQYLYKIQTARLTQYQYSICQHACTNGIT